MSATRYHHSLCTYYGIQRHLPAWGRVQVHSQLINNDLYNHIQLPSECYNHQSQSLKGVAPIIVVNKPIHLLLSFCAVYINVEDACHVMPVELRLDRGCGCQSGNVQWDDFINSNK